jgi:hypothetical protein
MAGVTGESVVIGFIDILSVIQRLIATGIIGSLHFPQTPWSTGNHNDIGQKASLQSFSCTEIHELMYNDMQRLYRQSPDLP